jgi:hypothetical protein
MRLSIFLLSLLTTASVSSCGGGAGGDGPVSADFSISATPGTQTAGGGGSTAFNVSIGAMEGFASNVALSASGLPAGATSSFAPSSVFGLELPYSQSQPQAPRRPRTPQ